MSAKWVVLLVFTLLLTAAGCQQAAEEAPPVGKRVGESITVQAITPLADLLEKPEDFLNKIVAVEGLVTGRCMGTGCWVSLDSGDPDNPFYAKSADHSFIFPESALDKKVRIQGEILAYQSAEDSHEGHDHADHEGHDHGAHDHAGGEEHVCPKPIYYLNPVGLEILE